MYIYLYLYVYIYIYLSYVEDDCIKFLSGLYGKVLIGTLLLQ